MDETWEDNHSQRECYRGKEREADRREDEIILDLGIQMINIYISFKVDNNFIIEINLKLINNLF